MADPYGQNAWYYPRKASPKVPPVGAAPSGGGSLSNFGPRQPYNYAVQGPLSVAGNVGLSSDTVAGYPKVRTSGLSPNISAPDVSSPVIPALPEAPSAAGSLPATATIPTPLDRTPFNVGQQASSAFMTSPLVGAQSAAFLRALESLRIQRIRQALQGGGYSALV